MIDSLLIANRGEIACRIQRTCRRLGIRTVAVFSEADRDGRWVREADVACSIGEAPAAQSYLNMAALLEAARRTGAQAVHPGFGFLAENPDFARACQNEGLLWIGPDPHSMEALGSKARAKELAEQAGVPILPGYRGEDQSLDRLRREALALGFPLMLKASAGGGGKGMRLVTGEEGLESALAGARAEALSAFGDPTLLLEAALTQARHIEVQVLGDRHGALLSLGERDCSVQRRHQKVLEECPAPGLSDSLRQEIQAAAVRLAAAAQYHNAGTVEFLLQGDRFYFLEMNTRLQVEHPVTEEVTGLDLVEWQIRIAEGEALPWTEPPVVRGHAIEARLYAEDPSEGYRPSTGKVLLWESPSEARVECGIDTGQSISPFYDPMVAKIVAHGGSRSGALRKLRRALQHTALLGVENNRDFLLQVLDSPDFRAGGVDVHWLGRQSFPPSRPGFPEAAAAALAQWLSLPGQYWRNTRWDPERFSFEGQEDVLLHVGSGGLELNGRLARAQWNAPELRLEWDGLVRTYRVVQDGEKVWVGTSDSQVCLRQKPRFPAAQRRGSAQGTVLAPLTGAVGDVLVQPGDRVEEGQLLLRLEAMKMDHRLLSPVSGVIEEVHCQPGEVVQAQSLLVRVAPS